MSPETRLSVSTVPTDATVTPLTDTIEGLAARLRMQRAGYRPVDTTMAQLEGKQ